MSSTLTQRSFKIRKASKKPFPQQTQQDRKSVLNLNDLHLTNKSAILKEEIKRPNKFRQSVNYNVLNKQYDGSEDNVVCYRFPHMKFCGCEVNCLYTSFEIYEILPELLVCGFESGTKTRSLLQNKITHILNLTSKQYTKRNNFFQYLNIDIHNNSQQDIKKFFRITNRFIEDSKSQGRILIHSISVPLSACFALGYLIGIKRIPIKGSIQIISKCIPNVEIPQHFLKQLESYDLQKLAFVTIKRDK